MPVCPNFSTPSGATRWPSTPPSHDREAGAASAIVTRPACGGSADSSCSTWLGLRSPCQRFACAAVQPRRCHPQRLAHSLGEVAAELDARLALHQLGEDREAVVGVHPAGARLGQHAAVELRHPRRVRQQVTHRHPISSIRRRIFREERAQLTFKRQLPFLHKSGDRHCSEHLAHRREHERCLGRIGASGLPIGQTEPAPNERQSVPRK